MFADKRYEEDRRKRAEEERERATAEAYRNATSDQRAVFDLFNGSKIKFDNKSAWLECVFTNRKEVIINVLGFCYEFKMFESTSPFEDRVRAIIKKELNDRGYYISPRVFFDFC